MNNILTAALTVLALVCLALLCYSQPAGQLSPTARSPQQLSTNQQEPQQTQTQIPQQQQQQREPIKSECNTVIFDNNPELISCKCDEQYCDSHRFMWPVDASHVLRVESAKSGNRFKQTLIDLNSSVVYSTSNDETDLTVNIEVNKYKQQVLGFGASLSDSTANLIRLMSDKLRKTILTDTFGQDTGNNYNLLRTTIGGSDFSSRPYTLADSPGNFEDFELKNFALQQEDLQDKIPMIHAAAKARLESGPIQDPIKVFAASWSPPAWIKTNENLVHGTFKDGKKYMDLYSRYLVKFLDAYKQNNVSIFSLSPQNEPLTPITLPDKINFNSFTLVPKQLAAFVKGSLIPELIKNNYTSDQINLLLWDENVLGFDNYASELMSSPEIREYVKAIGFHWYMHGWRGVVSYEELFKLRPKIPSKIWMISTEASFIGEPSPGNWSRGVSYARDIIGQLNSGGVGWIDWNMALNTSGGFTWCGNILDSSIVVDLDRMSYIKNPMYYTIGHISRFIKPQSYIVPTTIFASDDQHPDNGHNDYVTAVAAELPTSTIVRSSDGYESTLRRFAVVILNKSSRTRRIRLKAENCLASNATLGRIFDFELEGSSISSFAFNC